jgi:amidase
LAALSNLSKLTRDGFQKLMSDNKLDVLVTPSASVAPVLANGGFPGMDDMGVPFGIKGTEPQLIQIASGFEQAAKIRKPPTFNAGKTS